VSTVEHTSRGARRGWLLPQGVALVAACVLAAGVAGESAPARTRTLRPPAPRSTRMSPRATTLPS